MTSPKLESGSREGQRPQPIRHYVALTAAVFLLAAITFAYWSDRQAHAEDRAVAELLQWLKENGAVIDGIEIVDDEFGGRDLRSTRPIAKGEALVVLPRALMLGQDACNNDSVVQAALQLWPQMTQTDRLAVFLLANRNGSFWAPFINILPKTIPLPIFWDDEDLAWLQLPHFMETVAESKESRSVTFETIREALPNVTLDDFMHYWAVVASRAWGFVFDGEQQDVLVPLFDMANHEPNGIVAAMTDDQASTVLVANRDHDLGAFVHTYYSNHSNFMFLNWYGFTMEGIDEHMSCTVEDDENIWQLTRNLGDSSDFQTFMQKHRGKSATDANNVLDREILALERLYFAIEAVESAPTTLEDDEQLLADDSLTWNQRNAIRARMHEKLCWRSFKELAQTVTEMIFHPESWPAFETRFKNWDGFDSYSQHLIHILS